MGKRKEHERMSTALLPAEKDVHAKGIWSLLGVTARSPPGVKGHLFIIGLEVKVSTTAPLILDVLIWSSDSEKH